jgi:hypothetical protein
MIVSGQRLLELPPPVRQGQAFVRDGFRPIGQVVGDAHEGVQGAHGAAPRRGQQAEGVIEVAGLSPRQPFAPDVGLRQGQRGSARMRSHRSMKERCHPDTFLPDAQARPHSPPQGAGQEQPFFPPGQGWPPRPHIVTALLDLAQDGQAAVDEQLDVGLHRFRHPFD